jgi:hypothetical protein
MATLSISSAPLAANWEFNPKCNYAEVTFFSHVVQSGKLYDISVDEDTFKEIHTAVTQSLCKRGFEKKYKRYIKWDREYTHHFDQDKFSVVKKKILSAQFEDAKHYIFQQFDRSQLMVYQFPWSDTLHGIEYVTRYSFKMTNRLFLNMEIRDTVRSGGGGGSGGTGGREGSEMSRSHHVFANYNHADNVETTSIKQQIDALLAVVTPILERRYNKAAAAPTS